MAKQSIPSRERLRRALPLVAILLLATALRIWRLDAQSLWNDEGTSVQLALRDLPTITRDAAHDIHPPLYYYLLHFWTLLFGSSVWVVRSLSASLGVLTVGLTHALARPCGKRSALLAALLCAVSPFMVYYSQETRMYILLACLAVASTLALGPLVRGDHPRPRAYGLYGLLCVLTLYSHYMGFAVLLAHNLAALLSWLRPAETRPSRERLTTMLRWAVLQVAILLAYLPWLLLSWSSLSGWPAVREPLPLAELLAEVLQVLPFGMTMPLSDATLLAGAALAVLALVALLPHAKRNGEPSDKAGRRRLVSILLCAIVPVAMIYVLSLRRPMYKTKFLLVCAPFYIALLAHGLVTLHRRLRTARTPRWLAALFALLLLLLPLTTSTLSLAHLYGDPRYQRDDYQGIVAYIRATADPNDPILINAPSQIETVAYYHDGPQPLVPLPLERPLDEEKTEATLEQLVATSQRIYAVYWATDESDPARFIESWLAARCYKALDTWFGNLRLVVYAVPGTTQAKIEQPLDIVMEQGIRLQSYSLLTPTTKSGDILQLGLEWQAGEAIARRYKVFVHLVDARGAIVSQRDSEPVGGERPTTGWKQGETIIDAYGLLVRPGTPPGEHTLRVGLYDAETGERLRVASSNSEGIEAGNDAVALGRVTIASPTTPPPPEALDMAQRDEIAWPGLTLLSHNLHKLGYAHAPETPLHPGDLVELIFFWQRTEGSPPERYRLSLTSGREVVWSQERVILDGHYAPWGWAMGETIRDVQVLGLPSDLPAGRYGLHIEALGTDSAPERLESLTITP